MDLNRASLHSDLPYTPEIVCHSNSVSETVREGSVACRRIAGLDRII